MRRTNSTPLLLTKTRNFKRFLKRINPFMLTGPRPKYRHFSRLANTRLNKFCRQLSVIVGISAYFAFITGNVIAGAAGKAIAEILRLPFFIETKSWDMVLLSVFFIVVSTITIIILVWLISPISNTNGKPLDKPWILCHIRIKFRGRPQIIICSTSSTQLLTLTKSATFSQLLSTMVCSTLSKRLLTDITGSWPHGWDPLYFDHRPQGDTLNDYQTTRIWSSR